MTDILNPFDGITETDLALTPETDCATKFPAGTYWLLDGPGIGQSLEKMQAHSEAGGEFIHQVNPDGTLEHPERMWPRRGLEGKRVNRNGIVLADSSVG